eukprot:4880630-Ditylum_brightwellii.AAC.1
MGKTLIALLCIEYFLEKTTTTTHSSNNDCDNNLTRETIEQKKDDDNTNEPKDNGAATSKKQIWFLVPSVALAIQQSMTIKANIPLCQVETACHTSSKSVQARK